MVASAPGVSGAAVESLVSLHTGGSTGKTGPLAIRASDLDVRAVEWLWPNWIPRGAISVLAGDPGLGKSLLTVRLAADVTRGRFGGEAGGVLLLTAEDSREHTVLPRLVAAGADLERVHFAAISRDGFETPLLLPDDGAALRELTAEHGVRLVVIDPLSAHLAVGVDSWKDQKVRQALVPVHRLAEDTGVAILVVAHLNKGQGTNSLHRLSGSIGLPAAARSVLLLGRDPDDPDSDQGDQRVLAHVKSNVSRLADSLSLRIEPKAVSGFEDGVAAITETGISPYRGIDLLSEDPPKRGTKLLEAIGYLETELLTGPRLARELVVGAQTADISEQTLKRAKQQLRLESDKQGFEGAWMWRLPEVPESSTSGLDS